MSSSASGGTDVSVDTDLAVTGKPAQFGRGVMQDVSDKLLGQFVACLEDRLSADTSPASAASPASAGGPEALDVPGADTEPTPVADAAAAATAMAAAPAVSPAVTAPPAPRPAARPAPRPVPDQDDALDLGAAVLPVLARGYWRQGVGALV